MKQSKEILNKKASSDSDSIIILRPGVGEVQINEF